MVQLKDATDADAVTINFFVGVQIISDSIHFSIRDRSGTLSVVKSDELYNGTSINLTDYQLLRMELTNSSTMTTYFNGEALISPLDISSAVADEYFVYSVAAENKGIGARSKWLYLNGATTNITELTSEPTLDPTGHPTPDPTYNPTTYSPTESAPTDSTTTR